MNDDTLPLYTGPHSPQIQKMEPMASEPSVSTAFGKETLLLLGPENSLATCPYCRAAVRTQTKHTTTTRTHITAVLSSFLCCCCCLPYCCDSAKNTDHYCPSCQHYLGTYEK